MNYLYELGTADKLILRPNTNRIINGTTYESGEPYLFLSNVDIVLIYDEVVAEATANRTQMRRQNWAAVSAVMVTGIPLTSKVLALMGTKQDTMHVATQIHESISHDGETLYLNHFPVDGSLFVYNSRAERVAAELVGDSAVGEFEQGEPHTVFYQIETNKDVYSLEVPRYGYYSLEATGVGNKNKNNSSFYLNFPTLSLLPRPRALTGEDNVITCAFEFSVIDVGGKPTIAV